MGRTPRELHEFDARDPAVATDALAALLGLGRGWVNLEPAMDDGREPGDQQLLSPFSGRGPQVPVGSVVVGTAAGRKPQPTSIGLTHPRGPRTAPSLRDGGIVVPASWELKQDHGKRGLVWELEPGTEDAAQIVDVVLNAAFWLAGVELPNDWVAIVFTPSR